MVLSMVLSHIVSQSVLMVCIDENRLSDLFRWKRSTVHLSCPCWCLMITSWGSVTFKVTCSLYFPSQTIFAWGECLFWCCQRDLKPFSHPSFGHLYLSSGLYSAGDWPSTLVLWRKCQTWKSISFSVKHHCLSMLTETLIAKSSCIEHYIADLLCIYVYDSQSSFSSATRQEEEHLVIKGKIMPI